MSAKTKKRVGFARKPTRKEVEKILRNTNWDEYWRRGDEAIAKEIDAYARARAKSLEKSGNRIIL